MNVLMKEYTEKKRKLNPDRGDIRMRNNKQKDVKYLYSWNITFDCMVENKFKQSKN